MTAATIFQAMRRAKVVATIGPASQTTRCLEKLIRSGMDVVRLNFSHGQRKKHREVIQKIRLLSAQLGKPVAIIQDLQGLKVRTGSLEDGQPVDLVSGQEFTITTENLRGNRATVSTSYKQLPRDVGSGDTILISDGRIELRVISTSDREVICEVLTGGRLAEKQGINIPSALVSAPALTSKDLKDLEFGVAQEVDYVALSFVRTAEDLAILRKRLLALGADISVIAKLETARAIRHLEEILDASDGVMVARGDLGVELAPEKVPVIQKHVIKQAHDRGKLVIVATQMLESMVHSPRPSRAEASDVAGAIFDGADAVMLSEETASGKFPVQSVEMMVRIIEEIEKLGFEHLQQDFEPNFSFPAAICDAASHASRAIRARAIVAFTQSGSTARLISKYRPPIEIFGFTPHKHIIRRMTLYWGVKPIQLRTISNVDELIQTLEEVLLEQGLVQEHDNLIILTGAPLVERGHTSLMKLHSVKRS